MFPVCVGVRMVVMQFTMVMRMRMFQRLMGMLMVVKISLPIRSAAVSMLMVRIFQMRMGVFPFLMIVPINGLVVPHGIVPSLIYL